VEPRNGCLGSAEPVAKPTARSVFLFSRTCPTELMDMTKLDLTIDRHKIWAAIVQHRRWIFVFLLLNIVDSISTYVGLEQGATEMNPMATSLMAQSFGLSIVVKFAIVFFAIAVSAIMGHKRMFILKFMTVAIVIVVVLNLAAILRYIIGGIEHEVGRADPISFAIFIAIITGISLVIYVSLRIASKYVTKRKQQATL